VYNALPAPPGTYVSAWFDARNLKRGSFDIISTLDQACVIQLVGNRIQDIATAKNINAPRSLAVGNVTPTGTDYGWGTNDDWHPYFAITITTAVGPIVGLVTIKANAQS